MAETDPARPNVLLVVLDAARRDALTPYGAPAGATPAIADLARRGHALPHAYATSSWTLPSHASMLTGALPRALGLSQPPDGSPQSARAVLSGLGDRLLPARLGAAGYARHGFSANLWASGHAGFDTGFDDFTYRPSERVERNNLLLGGGRRARLAWALEGLRSRSDDGADALRGALTESINAAASQPDRPSFWFVNLIECHSPYLPPRPWNDLGPAERVRAAIDSQRYMGFEAICLQAAGGSVVPPESMARMQHLYERSIAYMDAWLADVLEALDRRGILEQTLVIVTADHGESFGEDGFVAHGF
jgi:arylsulfatase A-like enzyme